MLRGKEALDAQWQGMVTRFEAKDPDVSLRDLEVFHVYKWLLDSDKKPLLSTWVKAVLESNAAKPTGPSQASASIQSCPRVSKKPVKKETKSAEHKSSLLGFF